MSRLHQTLLLPGNEITAAQQFLDPAATAIPTGNGATLAGPFTVTFQDNCTFSVLVRNDSEPVIIAELRSANGAIDNLLVEGEFGNGQIDQEYILEHGAMIYELSILRAANTVLTPEETALYNREYGGHCPACASPEIHISRLEVSEDRHQAVARVECCSCFARWKHIYTFFGISIDVEDWDAPDRNVRRHQA